MFKRTACALLWLVAIGWAFNFISAYTGAPQLVGSVLAIAVAAFVWLDPLHLLWPSRERPSTSSREVVPTSSRVPNHI
jgi:hypothetical protein